MKQKISTFLGLKLGAALHFSGGKDFKKSVLFHVRANASLIVTSLPNLKMLEII